MRVNNVEKPFSGTIDVVNFLDSNIGSGGNGERAKRKSQPGEGRRVAIKGEAFHYWLFKISES